MTQEEDARQAGSMPMAGSTPIFYACAGVPAQFAYSSRHGRQVQASVYSMQLLHPVMVCCHAAATCLS